MPNEIAGNNTRPAAGDTLNEAIYQGRALAHRICRLRSILTGDEPSADRPLQEASCGGALGRTQHEAFHTLDSIRQAHNAIEEIEQALGMPGASNEVKVSEEAQAQMRDTAPSTYTGRGAGGIGPAGRSVPRYD